MSLMASFVDGKLQTQTASSKSIQNAKETNGSGMDSDAFLQLLVAEMQNQDPLEPTTNTEWVSQYATFTQVSEIQSIGDDMNNIKAQDLVGKDVIMKVTGDDGNTDYVSGKVDYVVYEEGDAYLSIDNSLYSIKDLDTVADEKYMNAYALANSVADAYKKLPPVENVTAADKAAIEEIYSKTSNMNDYEKSFFEKDVFEKINEYYKKLQEVLGEAGDASEETKDEENNTDTTDGTGETSEATEA